jgi:hypothetical protein
VSTPFLGRVSSKLTPTLCALIAVLVTGAWLWLAKWPLGVKGEWAIKPNAGAWPVGAWLLPVGTLAIFGGFAALSAYDRLKRAKNRREQIASTRLCLCGIFLVSLLWPWSLLGPGGTSNLVTSQWSDIANEYFAVAYQIEDANEFARSFAAIRQSPDSILQAHVATHPPGAVLFYYGARKIYEASPFLRTAFANVATTLTNESIAELTVRSNEVRRSATRSAGIATLPSDLPASAVGGAIWSAFLISVLLALATPAIYLIAASTGAEATTEEIVQAQTRGLIAAAFWALAPTANLFSFTLDAVVACGAAWTLAFLALRWRGGHWLWLCVAGAALALTSFVSFGALAIGVIAALAACYARRDAIGSGVKELLLVATSFVVVWFTLSVIFPMQPLVVFSQAMAAHRFATVNARSRGAWTLLNLVSFAVFCGWPGVAASLAAAWSRWRERANARKLATGAFAQNLLPEIPWAIGLAGLLVIVLLDISGKALGEVERLWMFLLPPLCVLVALYLSRKNAKVVTAFLILQALQTLLMAAWLAPLVLPI